MDQEKRAGQRSNAVKVCQVGYLAAETKFAMLTAAPAGEAVVRRVGDEVPVLAIGAAEAVADADSGDSVRWVDFSTLTEPGTYILDVPGVGRSDEFQVGPDIFVRPFRLAMRMFTGQRCGTSVSLAPDFPEYAYAACHTAPAEFHPSSGRHGTWDCRGGWHDAGDYGRYMVNSGITTGTLLWAYELYEDRLRAVGLDLPESGDPTPDVLAEIRWNIAWMLTMQDEDGGAWHKATTAQFPGFLMPEEDRDTVLIIGQGDAPYKTTAATADLGAVCAIAARLYRPFDPAFADICLAAAERAWKWLSAMPDHNFIHNPPTSAPAGTATATRVMSGCGLPPSCSARRERGTMTPISSVTMGLGHRRLTPNCPQAGRTCAPWRCTPTPSLRTETQRLSRQSRLTPLPPPMPSPHGSVKTATAFR